MMGSNNYISIRLKSLIISTIILSSTFSIMGLNYYSFNKVKHLENWNTYSHKTVGIFYKIHELITNYKISNNSVNKEHLSTLLDQGSDRFKVLVWGNKEVKALNNKEISEVLNETEQYWNSIRLGIEEIIIKNSSGNINKSIESVNNLLVALELETEITNEISSEIYSNFIIYQVIYSIILVFLVFSIVLYFNQLTERFYYILNFVKETNAGNLKNSIPPEGNDELTELQKNLNDMVHRLNESTVSSTYFETVLDSINNYIIEVTPKGNIKKANNLFIKDSGFDIEKNNINFFSCLNIEIQTIEQLEKYLFKKGELKATCGHNTFPIKFFISKLKDNKETNYIISFYDITDEIEMESQLYQSAKLISLGEMAAGVAHEVNNPLTVISGIISKIKKSETNHSFAKDIEKISESISRVTTLVKDLKTFTRKDDDGRDRRKDFLVDNAILKGIYLIEESYKDYNIQFIKKLNIKDIKVKGHENRFQQVLLNLFSNAKDAFEGSGGAITISSYQKDSSVVIEVKDNGKGIPKEIQSRIFETFFTTKEAGEGTGMGMSISTRIINEMDGKIGLTSQVNRGTTFSITLPISKISVSSEDKTGEIIDYPNIVTKTLKNQESNKFALVVDDEDAVREVIVFLLEEYFDFQIIEATNGKEALEIINNKNISYLFTDIQMPIMNGVELLKNIPSNKKRNMFTTVITGGIKNASEQSEVKKLCDYYMQKPIHDNHLKKLYNTIYRKNVA